MENYALFLLQNSLRDERLHRYHAEERLNAEGYRSKADQEALEKSKELAIFRICDLIDAIEKIQADGVQTGN